MRPIEEGATVRGTIVNGAGGAGRVSRSWGLFDREILAHVLVDALRKFSPQAQVRNPVMFVALIGSMAALAEAIAQPGVFTWSVAIWLLLAGSSPVIREAGGDRSAVTSATAHRTAAVRLPRLGQHHVLQLNESVDGLR
jgi:high-affinity K+ transport system ATPase subunit B